MDATANHSFDITTLAIIVVAALACGLGLARVRQPVIVGYIVAGLILGPSGLALVADRDQIALVAELGVLLLLFTIGLELDLRAFKRVYRVATLTMLLQALISVAVMLVIGRVLGWEKDLAILIGFAIALSSTAVAIKTLEETQELHTEAGRMTVGILIAQDLAVIPMLFIVGAMAGEGGVNVMALVKLAGAVVLLVLLIRFTGRRGRLALPLARFIETSTDLTALAAVTICFALAALSGLAGLSPAYGAFLAGLYLGNTTHRKQMLRAALPIQSLFIMAFFLSIGLLIDLAYVWDNLLSVVILLILVTLGKTTMNVAILHLLGLHWQRAFYIGVVLGQIGEFSFLLMATGTANGIVSPDANRMMVTVIALSLMTSPLWLSTARRLHDLATARDWSVIPLMTHLYSHQRRTARVQRYLARRRSRNWRRHLGERGPRRSAAEKSDTPEKPSD